MRHRLTTPELQLFAYFLLDIWIDATSLCAASAIAYPNYRL